MPQKLGLVCRRLCLLREMTGGGSKNVFGEGGVFRRIYGMFPPPPPEFSTPLGRSLILFFQEIIRTRVAENIRKMPSRRSVPVRRLKFPVKGVSQLPCRLSGCSGALRCFCCMCMPHAPVCALTFDLGSWQLINCRCMHVCVCDTCGPAAILFITRNPKGDGKKGTAKNLS